VILKYVRLKIPSQKNNIVRGLVGGENNIFVVKRRQVFNNI
jgi:hypothetical protein